MKRLLLVLLALLLCVGAVGCTPADDGNDDNDDNPSTQYYEPWYLGYSLNREPTLPEVSNELSDVRIHFPKEWSKNEGGYEVKLEFFQEEYALGELIQYRITATNYTEERITIPESDLNPNTFPGTFLRSDGMLWGLDALNSPPPARGDKDPMEGNGPWVSDAGKSCDLLSGSSVTYECVFVADPSFFIAGGKYYTYEFKGGFYDYKANRSLFDYAIPVEVTGSAATVKTTKTYQDWLALSGTKIDLPDLNEPASPEEATGGDYPHFCGEVIEVTVDYMVVKPDATLNDVRYDHMVPYTEELLKHTQSYIVPLATGGNGAYAADEFAVGNQVCVRFNDLQVYRVAAYDPSPVLRIVFSCTVLQSE